MNKLKALDKHNSIVTSKSVTEKYRKIKHEQAKMKQNVTVVG